MPLTLSPSTDQKVVVGQPLCFEGSGIVVLPQSDIAPIDIPNSGSHYTYNSVSQVFKKTSGTNGIATDATVVTTSTINGLQPFYIRCANTSFITPGVGGGNNNSHCFIGVQDSNDVLYTMEVMKYCNSNSSCGAVGAPGQTWVMTVRSTELGIIYTRGVNFNEIFYIRSNGVSLIFEHIEGGAYITDVVIPLPASDNWRLAAGAYYVGNEISQVAFWKGSYQGAVPITWTAPDGGTLTGSPSNQCFSTDTPGNYHVCIQSEFEGPLCVPVEADALQFTPLDMDCGQCAFTGDIVQFQSNGGLTGTLTVVDADNNPIGTVLDALTWQSPGHPADVTATYTLGGAHVDCDVQIIDRIKIYNILDSTIAGLAPGDTFQISTNYPYPQMIWENLDCPNIVSQSGLISIPSRLNDSCFGALDCQVRGRLNEVDGFTCENLTTGNNQQFVDIRILVDPIYPTPDFGGPKPTKWLPQTPEYSVLVNEFEGGCDETYLRNRVAVRKWSVAYNGLSYDIDNPCAPEPCCDPGLGFVDGYDPQYQVAKRLDDFWNVVGGMSGYFTVKDFRDGKIWRRVRFDSNMTRDHVNWKTIQSRNVALVWHPCCAVEPEGGVCPHNPLIKDVTPPTKPVIEDSIPINFDKIWVKWEQSADDTGVKFYEIEYDGKVVNVGQEVAYLATNLQPATAYSFRVRAYDYAHNPSDLSDASTATTFDHDITIPPTPTGLFEYGHTLTQITAGWNSVLASGDGTYEIKCQTQQFTGIEATDDLSMTYTFTPDILTDPHAGDTQTTCSVSVRSVYPTGKKSPWSPSVTMVFGAD